MTTASPGHEVDKKDESTEEEQAFPRRTWSVSIASLEDDRFRLRFPLIVTMEDYGSEFVASWPEVEAWGAGETEADAINVLKDELVQLCAELLDVEESQLGKLPRRWALSLRAVVEVSARTSRT